MRSTVGIPLLPAQAVAEGQGGGGCQSLMLEYCQDEMTPEQIENWGKHQKAVSDQTNLPLQLSP